MHFQRLAKLAPLSLALGLLTLGGLPKYSPASATTAALVAQTEPPVLTQAAAWFCWDPGSPDPCNRATLNDIAVVSANDVWAVGRWGTILRWDGQAWRRVNSPTTADLVSISMVSAVDGWALGEWGVFLHWDGVRWTEAARAEQGLSAISLANASYGWAVGALGAIWHWNGQAWSAWNSPVPQTWTLTDVEILSETDGWAMGDRDSAQAGCHDTRLWHWNGSTWHEVYPDGRSPGSPVIYCGHYGALSLASATDGWAVGLETYASVDDRRFMRFDGQAWTSETVEGVVGSLFDVDMVTADEGWAVGSPGQIWHWNGSTWSQAASPTNLRLFAVAMASANDGWAVGENGTILRWNSQVWQTVFDPVRLYDVALVSETDAWAVGAHGLLRHWDGSRWNAISSPVSATLNNVDMVSATDGWAVGDAGTILRFDGQAWTPQANVTSTTLAEVTLVSATDGWIAASNGDLLRWNGSTWSHFPTPGISDFHSLEIVSDVDGWAIVSGNRLARWNGASWALDYTAPLFLLRGVTMVSPSDGWAVGSTLPIVATVAARLSHWNGTAWGPPVAPVVSFGFPCFPYDESSERCPSTSLYSVGMASATDGWAVGEEGVVLHWNGTAWRQVFLGHRGMFVEVELLSPTSGWMIDSTGALFRLMPVTQQWLPAVGR